MSTKCYMMSDLMDLSDVINFVEYEEKLPQEENMDYADIDERDFEKELTS